MFLYNYSYIYAIFAGLFHCWCQHQLEFLFQDSVKLSIVKPPTWSFWWPPRNVNSQRLSVFKCCGGYQHSRFQKVRFRPDHSHSRLIGMVGVCGSRGLIESPLQMLTVVLENKQITTYFTSAYLCVFLFCVYVRLFSCDCALPFSDF